MKNTPKILIALTVIAVIATQSCLNPSSKLDKFWGKWKRSDTPEKGEWLIKKDDDAILLIGPGKDTVVARYDKKNDALKFWMFVSLSTSSDQVVVTYNEKNGHLLVNNGRFGEATRVK
ncbi:MAG TPA: hypothetical protein VFE53_06255 [Mucilaginibacter sp.]|jgi:hypothetical protein|nr:hypothetical protein [Mucilaginibacter sp.]